jgi:YggT family protein
VLNSSVVRATDREHAVAPARLYGGNTGETVNYPAQTRGWSAAGLRSLAARSAEVNGVCVNTILHVVYLAAIIYAWVIVARALLSWFPIRTDNPLWQVRRLLVRVTEPYLGLFRRVIPTVRFGMVGFDLSAFAGLIVLFMVVQIIVRL